MQWYCNVPALGQLVGVGVTVTVTVVVIVMNSGDDVSTYKTNKISPSANALNTGYRNLQKILKRSVHWSKCNILMSVPCKVCVGEGQGDEVTPVVPADVCNGEVTVAALITA